MTQPPLKPQTLQEFLSIKEKQVNRIRRQVLYNVFLSYNNTPDSNPIKTTGLASNLLNQFEGNELTFAIYVFGAIEQETLKGENFSLLDQLKSISMNLYNKTDITLSQFNKACQKLTSFYYKPKR